MEFAVPYLIQHFSSVFRYLIRKLVKLALNAPMQHSKFGNVFRNDQNKVGNYTLKSDLKLTVRDKFLRNGINYVDKNTDTVP